MDWRAWVFGGVIGAASLLVLSCTGGEVLSEEALLARCVQSAPTWRDYQEDIKGGIGAAVVATWRGHPVAVSSASGRILVTFALSGPWADYEASIPVLLRGPEGVVHRADDVVPDGDFRQYSFSVRDEDSGPLPWIKIHYPHTEQRITLDALGAWRAGLQ